MQSEINYDRIAFLYDRLAYLVFGDSIEKSRNAFLDEIADDAKILVIGGGTGSFLPALLERCSNCNILFIDSSEEMILRARQRIGDDPRVEFIHGTHFDIPAHTLTSVIITHFFLDLFNDADLSCCIESLTPKMIPDGVWIVSDFVSPKKWYQQLLLKVMYLFFRLTTSMRTRSLPHWEKAMLDAGFEIVERKRFADGFIHSVRYVTRQNRMPRAV